MRAPALRAVVVGAGLMGRWHRAALRRAGGRLLAVVDPDLARAEALAGRDAVACAELGELHAAGIVPDVVHVCTPLESHDGLTRQALELGADVIVEKPLAPDAASTELLLEAARVAGKTVLPVHQFAFQAGVQRLLAAGTAWGGITRCTFDAATAGAERTGLAPDEIVADILPHPLALFWRLGLDPAQADWSIVRPVAGELRAVAVADGTTFEIAISTRSRPTHARFGLTGERGSGTADLYHGFATVQRGHGERWQKVLLPFSGAAATLGLGAANLARRTATRELAYPGLRELVRRAYRSFATGSAPPVDAAEAIAVARGRDIFRSSAPDAADGEPTA